jgi:hypothetical protein
MPHCNANTVPLRSGAELVLRHCEFERQPAWLGGMGSFKARKTRALTLPISPGRSHGTLKLTMLEDESRVPAIDRPASRVPGRVACEARSKPPPQKPAGLR